MIQMTTIEWAQLILIETGFLFLIFAFSAHIRSTAAYQASVLDTEEGREVSPEEAQESPTPQRAKENLATWTPSVRRAPENSALLSAGNLLETAKIGFVQNFNNRRLHS